MKLTAKTLKGLEPVLAQELENIGARQIEILNRAVAFEGDLALMYKANFVCRTALCILKPIADFQVRDQDDLYERVRELPWEKIFCVDSKMLVDSFCMESVFTHTRFLSQRVKDAICDRFRQLFNKRPYVERDNPQIRVDVYLYRNRCILSLNSSGDSLFKRNYRQQSVLAPLNEVMAAGLIALSGWDTKRDFYDPMCGSGTLLMEAAMMACQMPAQYYRKNFSFRFWNDFDALLWKKIQEDALAKITDPECEIYGSDISHDNLEVAAYNLKAARMHKDVQLRQGDFLQLDPPTSQGMIICNPPYGERLELDDDVAFYQSIGDKLKKDYSDWDAWFISSSEEAMKHFGLHPSVKHLLYNGPLACRFHKFELYSGSRKKSKE